MQDLRTLIRGINLAGSKREIEGNRFVEEQKIKKALGPAEWKRL